MGYELGCNLFSSDKPCEEICFSKATMLILRNAYKLIGEGREVFIEILEKSLANRGLLFERFGKADKLPGAPIAIPRE